jgi:GNAT superfamily N-acetyltransferase
VRVATVEPDPVIGFVTTVSEPGFLELVDLFTDPGRMRRGAATVLINDIAAFAASIGVDRVSVVGNPHALDFYERVGFVAAGHVATEFDEGIRMHLDTSLRLRPADDLGA